MRLYTKLSAVLADDTGLDRRLFSVEDIEENDDTSTNGGGPGGFTLAAAGQAGASVTVSLQAVSPAKHLVLLVDGSVTVTLNGSNLALPVASSGSGSTFVWGKLLLTGSSVNALVIANTSTGATAKCLLGYAG